MWCYTSGMTQLSSDHMEMLSQLPIAHLERNYSVGTIRLELSLKKSQEKVDVICETYLILRDNDSFFYVPTDGERMLLVSLPAWTLQPEDDPLPTAEDESRFWERGSSYEAPACSSGGGGLWHLSMILENFYR